MEKRKLIPLSFMMLCSLCFSTACKTSTTSTNAIAIVDGKTITAENLYISNLYNPATAEYVYNILEKALIQSAVPASNSMKSKVENEVAKWEKSIKEDSKLNGTDYEEDLAKALEEKGVSSVEELIDTKIYDLQKEYAEQLFLQAKGQDFHKAYIDNNYLYHVSDILLNVSGTSSEADLYGLSISADEAKNIYQSFKELVEGENHYTVAEEYSKGTTASNGGDLGIVSLNDKDITNELRYALIGYSSMIQGKYNEFDLPTNIYSEALNNLYNGGLEAIPYSYIKGLNEVHSNNGDSETKNYETNTNFYYAGGNHYLTSTGRSYYRNIIFNVLLNTKTPRFITLSDEELKPGVHTTKMQVRMPNVDKQGYSLETVEQNVLTNELGNPYVIFKDEKGLHVISVNKTPFDEDLYEYYSVDPSPEDGYVAYSEFGNNMDDRLAEVEEFSQNYITRNFAGNEGNEKLFSFEIFKFLLNKEDNGSFKIVNTDVEKMIYQYMDSTSASVDTSKDTTYKGYYDVYSNIVWFKNQAYIVQEVPLLSCLTKASDGNYGCTYKFGKGFLNHAPSSDSGSGGNQ